MPVFIEFNKANSKGDVPIKVYTHAIDPKAITQLKNTATLPIVGPHVAAMPDVHLGVGATVGSVIPTRNAIIPAAVGVDIGCGMNAIQLSLRSTQLPDNLALMRSAIERAIPVGLSAHKRISARDAACNPLAASLEKITKAHPDIKKRLKKADTLWVTQMATLGSGNHFIEVCIDEAGYVWLMLHSGSRGMGNAIGSYFIERARKQIENRARKLIDKNLAWFDEAQTDFHDYMAAVNWAQEYARINRQEMMKLTLRAIEPFLPKFTITHEAINCHHNYVEQEQHFGETLYITRKGAINAKRGQLGIIPGSMGDKSFIVRGLGNADSFCSCSHGAGRVMSRSAARQRFTREDLATQTRGVECRKDSRVIDEIPAAYKNIDDVMNNQSDLVDIVHTLKQVICIKG
ncbi:RtcB family protein [Marinagarivorans cellulosilyticus]|uniref:3'-phosphate/5'-hydroxy nucleic acid ligase n=1 Tax=Marinagarivorans cellulosilyticus TaxID=2721545 RepID=A0AAN2BJZ0_9GAMM|nr:RtcB family protein [Marinagarivorans cellulosilyticus]BCD97518.1 tRNA-splicing ligase RtcB (3'-phosphate/5'-hydroxy nucleic acid ligase) [Marinagarivorans cellulosilyticus]